MQDPRIGPGIGKSEDGRQLFVRLNVPFLPLDDAITWDRVDVFFGERCVVLIEPRALTLSRRVVARFRRRNGQTPADFVSVLLGQVVDLFQLMLLSIEGVSDPATPSQERADAKNNDGQSADPRSLMRDLGRAAERLAKLLERLIADDSPVIGNGARSQFQVALDRVDTIGDEIERYRERAESNLAVSRERENPLGAESPEVIDTAARVGERRLRRLNPAHAITALIGAFAVSFGAIAMSWVAGPWVASLGFERAQLIGAFAFPIGFVILLVGKGELFTENFFVPVTGVIVGRGTIRELLELWGYVLFFNMIGSVIVSFLMSRAGVLDGNSAAFLKELALNKVNYPFWDAFMKAIFAGWLMTIMTWLILAVDGVGPRIVIIWMIGFLIVAAHFNHVVISAPEIFTSIWLGAPITFGDWFVGNFVPALLGNLIGGVVFVTALGFAQARWLEQSEL